MIIFPHDYAAIGRDADWRDRLFWPKSYRAVRDATLDFVRRLLKATSHFETEEQRQAYVASLQAFAPWAFALVEAANTLDGLQDVEFGTDLAEIRYLKGNGSSNPGFEPIDKLIKIGSCRHPWARQILWTTEWTSVLKLPATLVDPDVVAFNRNPGLIQTAQASRRRIRYDNVEQYYGEVLKSTCEDRASPCPWDADALREVLSSTLHGQSIAEPLQHRLLDLMVARLRPILDEASRQLRALRMMRSLPQEIWAGTGGYWPSRIVGLEVMRRDGIVRRFDHGYNKALNRFIEQAVFVEAMVSTHFVFVSEGCVQRWRQEPVQELVSPGAVPHFESFPPVAGKRITKKESANGFRRSRPRVLYATGQLKGLWRNLPPPLPTMVYVDWTLRVAEMLQKMPIDLICRPHPRGVFGGKPHPLSRVAEVPSEPFEQLIDDVDIVITDSPFSRVLCEALCTGKPIIFLDPGHDYFCDAVLPSVKERCTIIDLRFDERGLPQVNPEQLAAAIFDTQDPGSDVIGQFRQMFAA
jgi:hypothetical protein